MNGIFKAVRMRVIATYIPAPRQKSLLTLSKFSFSIGKTLEISKHNYVFPVAGIVLFENSLQEKDTVGFDLPFFLGGKFGVDFDRMMVAFADTWVGPTVRVSVGAYVGAFNRLSQSLGYYQLYFNVMVGVIGFTSK